MQYVVNVTVLSSYSSLEARERWVPSYAIRKFLTCFVAASSGACQQFFT